jgi:hypothetical protein
MAEELLLWLDEPMPNLKSLSLSRYPDEHELDSTYTPFNNLPSLESLKVPTIHALNFVHPPSYLKNLKIEVNLEPESVDALNQLSGLCTLTISQPRGHALLPTSESVSLKLPNLHTLSLIELPRNTVRIKYELPELRDLVLADTAADFRNYLPDVHPIHVHWGLPQSGDNGGGSVADNILRKYTRARTMSTTTDRRGDVLEVIKELKAEGKLSAELERLVFEDNFGTVHEVIYVETI